MEILVELAREMKVIQGFASTHRCGKKLSKHEKTEKWGEGSKECHTTAPPSLFDLLKWKSDECRIPPSIKWRDIISFSHHFLKPWAKLMSRSL